VIIPVRLLGELRRLGVSCYLAGDKLALKPASRVPPELEAQLLRHKKRVLRFLTGPAPKDKAARALWEAAFLATLARVFQVEGVATLSRAEGERRWQVGQGTTTPATKPTPKPTPYRGPWPDRLDGLGEASVDSFTTCEDCLDETAQGKEMVLRTPAGGWVTVNRPAPTSTWTRYGTTPLCLSHARRRMKGTA
jgi:hypothetical protein